MDLNAHAILTCSYSDPVLAEKLYKTLIPDNGEYISTQVRGSDLVSECSSDSILSLRSTLDDFLACLGTAERVILKSD